MLPKPGREIRRTIPSSCNCHGMSDISAGQSFAEDKDIRQDQIRGKAVSGTSESCGNFVEYKEHTVLVAKFARAFQEGDAVHPHTARTLQQRLDDKTVQAVVVLCKSLFQGTDLSGDVHHMFAFAICVAEKRLLIVPGAGHGMSHILDKEGYEKAVLEFWRDFDRKTSENQENQNEK